ncbi:non-canonical heme oxygenase HOZ, chloroplastic-like [Bidens hawaiensis]|uniref:non-canonical heme oxygenase HOZ, chloroplastic-like n=1 Tax=Bidens hawaiensis TaxID=980011 RepID=UPI00404B8479
MALLSYGKVDTGKIFEVVEDLKVMVALVLFSGLRFGFPYYKEKFTKVDNTNMLKETEVVEGWFLDIGFDLYRVRIEIQENLNDDPDLSCILKLIVEYEVKYALAANALLVTIEPLLGLIKTDLRNRMGDDYLNNALVFAVEKETFDKVTEDDSASSEDAAAADVFQLIKAHQEKAARLPPIEEVKTVLYHGVRGILSTFSQKYDGYPSGSMVDFACDASGSPILAVSSLAVHTKDLLANSKCSLLLAKDPEDRTDLVITVHGDAVPVNKEDRDVIRTAYLARHPEAFWVDFGDFQFLRIEPKVVRFVSGVATALLGSGEFTKEEFAAAKVDPIYQFSKPVTSHMNKDHSDDTKLMVQGSTSVPVDFAYMLDIDSLGFNVKAGYQGTKFKLRIPFPRPAQDRKDVKTLIVEMLQAAKSRAT